MKIGDLVKMKLGYSEAGLVMRIDEQHHGARQAFKVSKVERGHCIRPVLVLWPDAGYSYEESTNLEVISESR